MNDRYTHVTTSASVINLFIDAVDERYSKQKIPKALRIGYSSRPILHFLLCTSVFSSVNRMQHHSDISACIIYLHVSFIVHTDLCAKSQPSLRDAAEGVDFHKFDPDPVGLQMIWPKLN